MWCHKLMAGELKPCDTAVLSLLILSHPTAHSPLLAEHLTTTASLLHAALPPTSRLFHQQALPVTSNQQALLGKRLGTKPTSKAKSARVQRRQVFRVSWTGACASRHLSPGLGTRARPRSSGSSSHVDMLWDGMHEYSQ